MNILPKSLHKNLGTVCEECFINIVKHIIISACALADLRSYSDQHNCADLPFLSDLF